MWGVNQNTPHNSKYMKRILFSAFAVIIATAAMAVNKLEFSNVDIEAGGTATVIVTMTNQYNIAGFQFEMTLPQGLSVATNDRGKMLFNLNRDRIEDHVVTSNTRSNGTISVLAYSVGTEPFYGTDGEILTFQLKADANFYGSHNVAINDIAICTTTGQYALDGGKTSFTVRASMADQPATDVTIDRLYAVMNVNESTIFTATVSPENATVKNVIWSTSDESIAAVDANGKVTAVGKGIAVITTTTTDGTNLRAQSVVFVDTPFVKGDISGDGIVDITDVNELIEILLKK